VETTWHKSSTNERATECVPGVLRHVIASTIAEPLSTVSELHGDQCPIRPVPRTEQGFSTRRRLQRRVPWKHPRISSTSPHAESVSPERRRVYDDQQRRWILLRDSELDPRPVQRDILPRRNCRPGRLSCYNVHLLARFDLVCPDVDRMPGSRHQPCGMCGMKLATALHFLPHCMGWQRGYDKNVCPSVKRVDCDITEERSVQIFIGPTIRKIIWPSLVRRRMVGGGRPLLLEILGQADPVRAKSPIFSR